MYKNIMQCLCVGLLCIIHVRGALTDYFTLNAVKTYFGYDEPSHTTDTSLDEFTHRVPYEVSEVDEKFISQAIELTGVAISELDACQHRLILKLKSDCNVMNDMMISKLAVGLLNCQSYIEGRKIYPCTEKMTLKECTSDMDADVWNSYHLMTNRARAVCYTIRQSQFRGLTEHTVNRLMEASQHQIHTLHKISSEQENIQNMAHTTLETILQGHTNLAQQQKDIQKAQLFGQLQLEDNINKLADEKKMILDSQAQLAAMTKVVQEKLIDAAAQIEQQSSDTTNNHKEILDDLLIIQNKAHDIFQRIEDASAVLLTQSEIANKQYQATLEQLKEMNKTVHSLVSLVGVTKQALEERLSWITASLGGTDFAIERLYIFLWHSLLLLVAMVACAFLGANFASRVAVVSLIPANLALSLVNFEYAIDVLTLLVVLTSYIILQSFLISSFYYIKRRRGEKLMLTENSGKRVVLSRRSTPNVTPENSECNAEISRLTGSYSSTPISKRADEKYDSFNEYFSPTPPISRNYFRRENSVAPSLNGSIKSSCMAYTKLGTPCKSSTRPGTDFCYRHQKGSSVMR